MCLYSGSRRTERSSQISHPSRVFSFPMRRYSCQNERCSSSSCSRPLSPITPAASFIPRPVFRKDFVCQEKTVYGEKVGLCSWKGALFVEKYWDSSWGKHKNTWVRKIRRRKARLEGQSVIYSVFRKSLLRQEYIVYDVGAFMKIFTALNRSLGSDKYICYVICLGRRQRFRWWLYMALIIFTGHFQRYISVMWASKNSWQTP